MLYNTKNSLRRAAGRILAIHICVLNGNGAKTTDKAHLKICGSLTPSVTILNIETAAVPCAMVVALLAVLCLPTRTMGRCPLCRQIALSDRERSSQPQQDTTAG